MPSFDDPIGVREVPVNATDRNLAVRRKALQRLDVMQKELQHVQAAMARLRHGLMSPVPMSPATQRDFVSAMMDSRNWVLSLVASHGFIQMLFGTWQTVDPFVELAAAAARVGKTDGLMDPDFRAWDNAHK